MAKASGSTRTSSSPKGLSGKADIPDKQKIAEGLYGRRQLTIDPDDAVFESASIFSLKTLSENIEANTDYMVYEKEGSRITLLGKEDSMSENRNRYGVEVGRYDMGNKSLIDVIIDINKKPKRKIYNR